MSRPPAFSIVLALSALLLLVGALNRWAQKESLPEMEHRPSSIDVSREGGAHLTPNGPNQEVSGRPERTGDAVAAAVLVVVDASTGHPLEGALVHALGGVQYIQRELLGTSASDGTQRVSSRGPLVVALSGYNPARLARVVPSSTPTVVELKPLSMLTGRVVNAALEPVSSAHVAFVPTNGRWVGWDNRLGGYEGTFTEAFEGVGFEVRTNSAGEFTVPRPEMKSTLRIYSPEGVWLGGDRQQRAGLAHPPESTYILRDIVRTRIEVVDDAGHAVDHAGLRIVTEPATVPIPPWVLTDEEEKMLTRDPNGNVVYSRATTVAVGSVQLRAIVQAEGMHPATSPDQTVPTTRFSDAVPVIRVVMRPLPQSTLGTLVLTLKEQNGATSSGRMTVRVALVGSEGPVDLSSRYARILNGQGRVSLSLPSGTYRVSAASSHGAHTNHLDAQGRQVAVLRSCPDEEVVVPAGEVTYELLKTKQGGRVTINLNRASGEDRPAKLKFVVEDETGGQWSRNLRPAPDAIDWYPSGNFSGRVYLMIPGYPVTELTFRLKAGDWERVSHEVSRN